MDIQPQQAQTTISDDQELAKVLAGINKDSEVKQDQPFTPPADENQQPAPEASQENSQPAPVEMPAPEAPAMPQVDPAFSMPPIETPSMTMPSTPEMGNGGGELEGIKQQAIGELRPLVEKLNVSIEEKFDTYLLLLRSTDDKSLIEPAHEAAKNIPDETRRAQALLDIIKEIDFLSGAH